MSDITADEFVRYVDVIGPKAVKSSSEKSLTDLITLEQMPGLSRLAQVYIFTARCYASAVLAVIVCLSVCLSVCPSVCHKSELYKDA